jgi:hypothetical protein
MHPPPKVGPAGRLAMHVMLPDDTYCQRYVWRPGEIGLWPPWPVDRMQSLGYLDVHTPPVLAEQLWVVQNELHVRL